MSPVGKYTLSRRAVENLEGVDYWEPLVAALANPWSSSNPDGMAILGVAENTLMHAELQEQIKSKFEIRPVEHFSYGNGPQGSPRLRNALASFFNDRFHPQRDTTAHEFCVSTGVTAMIDHLTWCICDDGEGILFPQPLYAGFTNDLPTRARGKLMPVPFERADGTFDANDVFDSEANVRCLERAYQKCEESGIKIKGVIITNPHNPLGKCYPMECIKAVATFCAKYGLHYLSDEIYAMSVFDNAAYPDATEFTSVLSINLSGIIDPLLVHVLYGMSKDFCGNGLRLGTLHSRNTALRSAVMGIAAFGWEAYLVQDMWARILEDKEFLDFFISENQRRLGARYAYMVDFLRQHKIPFFEGGNAGVFVWVDLRSWFRNERESSGSNELLLSHSNNGIYKNLETSLSKIWWQRGVMISKGTSYLTEELGWFRIVFTVDEGCLRAGLQRFIDGLNEATGGGHLPN